jgi:hypothetical protein
MAAESAGGISHLPPPSAPPSVPCWGGSDPLIRLLGRLICARLRVDNMVFISSRSAPGCSYLSGHGSVPMISIANSSSMALKDRPIDSPAASYLAHKCWSRRRTKRRSDCPTRRFTGAGTASFVFVMDGSRPGHLWRWMHIVPYSSRPPAIVARGGVFLRGIVACIERADAESEIVADSGGNAYPSMAPWPPYRMLALSAPHVARSR